MQNQCRYSIKDDDDVKFPLVNIRKMQNIAESEISAINKTVLLPKAIIGRKKLGISIIKTWGLQ